MKFQTVTTQIAAAILESEAVKGSARHLLQELGVARPELDNARAAAFQAAKEGSIGHVALILKSDSRYKRVAHYEFIALGLHESHYLIIEGKGRVTFSEKATDEPPFAITVENLMSVGYADSANAVNHFNGFFRGNL